VNKNSYRLLTAAAWFEHPPINEDPYLKEEQEYVNAT
jgi:hypothetical protein